MKQKMTVKFPAFYLFDEELVDFAIQDGFAIRLSDLTKFVILDDSAELKIGSEIRLFGVGSFLKEEMPMYCFTFKRSTKLCLRMFSHFVTYTLSLPFYKLFGASTGLLLPAVDAEYKKHYTWTGKIVALSDRFLNCD